MPNAMPAARRRWQATFIISLFFVAVVAAAGTGWWYARESPPHQGPIVLISVDSLQARQLGAYGSPRREAPALETPAIDALAADGVLFTRTYAHSPQTLPAQASLLTGQLPFEHGVRDEGGYTLGEDTRTLAEQLRSRGFETGGAVSSFLLRPATGIAQGFSFYDAELQPHEDAVGTVSPVTRDGLETYAAAEEWMRLRSGQRYFVFIEVGQSSADTVVARTVELLKERNLYDSATIILTAAHGDSAAGIRLDDRSLAIPLIVKQPDGEGAGRNVVVPVQQIDIAPTLLDFVRAPVPGALRGRSLRPVLDREDGAIRVAPVYAESLEALWRFGGAPVFAVTLDGYRLTRGATETVARIDETLPESSDAEEVGARLRAALDSLLDGRAIEAPGDIAAADEGALAALGYLPGLRTMPAPAGPSDPEAQAAIVDAHRSAVRAAANGQYVRSVAALRSILANHPDLAVIQYQVGALLSKAGRFGDAIDALMAAAGLLPEDPDISRTLSITYLRARRLEDATTQAAAAVELAQKASSPRGLADAHEVAARVALATKDADAALMHAQESEKADPARPMSAFVRGRLAYDEGTYDEALAAFEEAVRQVRESGRTLSELHLSVGETLAQLDRFSDAEAAYREELRAFPSNASAYSSLAMLYRASNRDDEAAHAIEGLIAASPTPEGYATAVRLWTLVGQRGKADALRADARTRFR